MPSPRTAGRVYRYGRPSIYALIRVPHAHRARREPRVARPYRTKSLTNLTAFYRNRFYEIDRWYKARIVAPLNYPKCYEIDPEDFQLPLVDRLKAEKQAEVDPILNEPVDIGLPFKPQIKTVEKQTNRADLEHLARHRKLIIDEDEVENDSAHLKSVQPQLLKKLADHFAIFRDLFHQDAHFYPVVPLSITFDFDSDTVTPVHFGNTIKAEEAESVPKVFWPSKPETLWTLLMVNPDGNIFEENKDVLHWLIANIPGNQVEKGEVLCEYLQPLPLLGTGWHRIVFLLFQQTKPIATEALRKHFSPSKKLETRTFCTAEFYKDNEDVITPAGLSFFQSDWDMSVTDCFHKHLEMEEPTYEYEWPKPSLPKQMEFPKFMAFNKYLDVYRDPQDLEKDVLVKRLQRISPFKAEEPQLRYPNIFMKEDYYDSPTWLASEKEKERLGLGRYAGLYRNVLPP